MNQIIKKPLITEKNTLHNAMGIYVFEVASEATKVDVKKAVEGSFSVVVSSVKTINCRGRAKVTRAGKGKITYWKKAFVRLRAGDKIALFEGV